MDCSEVAGLLLQAEQLSFSGKQSGTGRTLNCNFFAPYSPALLELVICMLQHETQRKSAKELVQLPVLLRLVHWLSTVHDMEQLPSL